MQDLPLCPEYRGLKVAAKLSEAMASYTWGPASRGEEIWFWLGSIGFRVIVHIYLYRNLPQDHVLIITAPGTTVYLSSLCVPLSVYLYTYQCIYKYISTPRFNKRKDQVASDMMTITIHHCVNSKNITTTD